MKRDVFLLYFFRYFLRYFLPYSLLFLFSFTAVSVRAESIPAPSGPVILTVSGAISQSNEAAGQGSGSGNADKAVHFDRAMLEALPQHQFRTTTPWTDGSHHYQGVLLKELLTYVGAKGDKLVARALNDYHSVISLEPIKDYPVLLAMKSDGKAMRVRGKGPIWILYPMTDFPELNSTYHHAGMVWQLRYLEVR